MLVREAPFTLVLFGSRRVRLVFWLFISLALGRFTFMSIAASELRESLARVDELATRDHMTKLYNRRHMDGLMAQELARVDRGGANFCLAMVDIDHFKRVNDDFGHEIGDKTLVELARLLWTFIRERPIRWRTGVGKSSSSS